MTSCNMLTIYCLSWTAFLPLLFVRIALVVLDFKDLTLHTQVPTGSNALRIRLLRKLGYGVLEVCVSLAQISYTSLLAHLLHTAHFVWTVLQLTKRDDALYLTPVWCADQWIVWPNGNKNWKAARGQSLVASGFELIGCILSWSTHKADRKYRKARQCGVAVGIP